MKKGAVHIGLSMLLHDKKRLFLSICGIGFAVIIMFMQLGFFNGINDSQANIARLMNADLVLIHSKRTHLNKWNRFAPIHVQQVLSTPGVSEAIPIYKDGVGLKNPDTKQVKRTIMYAFPPDSRPFRLKGMDPEMWDLLKVQGNCFYDVRSREIFGEFKVGDSLTVDDRPMRLAGFVEVGPNIINDGTLFCGEGSWRQPGSFLIMALFRFQDNVDHEAVTEKIKANLDDDLVIMTPQELAQREIMYTVINAPIGAIFGVGLIVSLFIGTVICYQILFNEITDNLAQYATLKAMGFSSRFLYGVILEEASLLAVLGFIPGFLISTLIYQITSDATRLIMDFNVYRVSFIFFLTLIMCLVAGFLAMRKVLTVDPADLY
ncbi:FtsX-like permease family protein [Terasakiella pusilla]|uniref:FtsX-like permease family protein n=1 Tax=Terasakiella pusilla TaxID=64973 RepID=UPI00048F964B|nr:FtsX-like permease family protein [Terasakiella pusilla]